MVVCVDPLRNHQVAFEQSCPANPAMSKKMDAAAAKPEGTSLT